MIYKWLLDEFINVFSIKISCLGDFTVILGIFFFMCSDPILKKMILSFLDLCGHFISKSNHFWLYVV